MTACWALRQIGLTRLATCRGRTSPLRERNSDAYYGCGPRRFRHCRNAPFLRAVMFVDDEAHPREQLSTYRNVHLRHQRARVPTLSTVPAVWITGPSETASPTRSYSARERSRTLISTLLRGSLYGRRRLAAPPGTHRQSGLANAASASKVPSHSCRPVAGQDRDPIHHATCARICIAFPARSIAPSQSPNWLNTNKG